MILPDIIPLVISEINSPIGVNNSKEVNTELNIDEFRKTIKLQANETLSSSCENNEMKKFTVFSSFIHNTTGEKYVTLTKFELTNITTKHE